MKKKLTAICILTLMLLCTFAGKPAQKPLDYSNPKLWAFAGAEDEKAVDTFFIAPSISSKDSNRLTLDLDNENDLSALYSAIGMQSNLYGNTGAFYAPYYREMTMEGYKLPEEEWEPYLSAAYQDVRAAFKWYLENKNDGRPIIIAGYSQGADHGMRLLKEFGKDPAFREKLVAAYLIGWRITDEDLQEAPYLKMAQNETDTGVIVSFDCEAENVNDTIIIPAGTFSHSINPLNWKTDSTPASKDLNLGFVYPSKYGTAKKFIPNFCGGYLDPVRGALKVTGVSASDYPPLIDIVPSGSYHVYDYEFFYNNIRENVKKRTESYLNR